MKRAGLFLLMGILFASCGKDNGDPTIKLVEGPGFVSRDTVLKVNDSIKVKVEAEWNGFDLLEKIDLYLNGEYVVNYPMKEEGVILTMTLRKSALETENWEFRAVDKRRNSASVELTLTKDPNSEYGSIVQISPIVLGAQKSANKPGFLSFQTNQTFTIEQAFPNQDKIDLLFYSDADSHATFASPGADFPASIFDGIRNPLNWTTRNLTRFIKVEYSESKFNAIVNDVPMVDGWSDDKSLTQAKNLAAGDVWLFRLQSGRKGILRVTRITAGDDGDIEFSVKIQD